MTDTDLRVRGATEDDILEMVSVIQSAFRDSAFNHRVYPSSSPETATHFADKLRGKSADSACHFFIVEHHSHERQPHTQSAPIIVGWARWDRKPAPTTLPPRPIISPSSFPPSGDPALAARFYQANADATRANVGHVDHWFLSMMIVRAEWQRRGVGSVLMRFGLELADDGDGWAAATNASEEGRGLYERFGFREVSRTWLEELGTYTAHMMRDSKGRRGKREILEME